MPKGKQVTSSVKAIILCCFERENKKRKSVTHSARLAKKTPDAADATGNAMYFYTMVSMYLSIFHCPRVPQGDHPLYFYRMIRWL